MENEMKTKYLTDTISNSSASSVSSFDQKKAKPTILFNSDSNFSNSSDLSQAIQQNNIINKKQHLLKEGNEKNYNDQSNINQSTEDADQNSILLEEMISSLQKKINYFQSKKNMLDSEMKQTPKIHDQNQNENFFLKTKNENIIKNNNNCSTFQYPENKAAKISKKVEKYIYAISHIDEEIHECIQSIDSKTSFLNQSKTYFLKIQNIIDLVKFKIEKERKHHEIILMKYRNEFKRLARERNEIEKLQFEKSMLKYQKDQIAIKNHDQILNKKDNLTSELKLITAKKIRSNDRLKRMESQLERLIQAESNIKKKLKKVIERDKKQTILSNLLNKLDEKLKELQNKKEKRLHKDQIETQILLQTFDNLVQIIQREEDNNELFEPIYLPNFPAKLIQNKNCKEENLSKIEDEINVVQDDIKLLNREIHKTKKINDKYQTQIYEIKKLKNQEILNNNYVMIHHNENVNVIYRNSKIFVPNINDNLNELSVILETKRNQINKRKNKMIYRYEKYLLILYEYSKMFLE